MILGPLEVYGYISGEGYDAAALPGGLHAVAGSLIVVFCILDYD